MFKEKKLIHEIKNFSKKRQDYIKGIVEKEKDKGKNSLDMKIYNCLKKQAAPKKIDLNKGVMY